jgi:hypothetical protein
MTQAEELLLASGKPRVQIPITTKKPRLIGAWKDVLFL